MTWSVTVKDYHAVASWTWAAGDKGDVCSICRMPFDGCPPDCKVAPHPLPPSAPTQPLRTSSVRRWASFHCCGRLERP